MSKHNLDCIFCDTRIGNADRLRNHMERFHTAEQRQEFAQIMSECVGDLSDGAWLQSLTDLGVDPAWMAESVNRKG